MSKNIIKSGIKTLAIEDTGKGNDDESNVIQQLQVKLYDAIKNCGKLGQYGLYSNAPTGSFVIIMQVNGQEEYLFGIEDDVNNRPRNLKEGEVMLYNTLTKNYFYFSADGKTQVYTKTDFNMKVEGNANISAKTTTINSPTKIVGGLTVDTIKANSIVTDDMAVNNGASGTFDITEATKGIVTGGS